MATSKPSLIFVHGFRGNHLGIEKTANYFKDKGYKVYVPDIPPTVNSKREKLPALTEYTADGYATFIADYILQNKIDSPILIGHSMGSIIVAATANKFPNLINEKVVFLSPIAVKPPRFITNLAPLTAILPNKLVGYVTTKYLIVPKDKKTLRHVLDITYKCSEKFTSGRDVARAAKFSSTYAISDFDFDKQSIFIAGEKDRLNSQTAIKKTAAQFRSDAVFLKNSGHLINYECPLVLAEAIEKFIK